MKYNNTVEYQDAIANLVKRNLDIVKTAKTEVRELTEEEETEFNSNEEEISTLTEEQKELENQLNDEQNDTVENDDDKNIDRSIKMTKEFKLMAELRSAMETGKTVTLENRAYTVASEGDDVVETDVYSILEPLRAKNVLVGAGAKFLTNLVGNVQVPVMTGGNVAWAGETDPASDGSGSFDSITLSPKRLTAKFPISLQFLAQDSVDAEAVIRQDIINAINDKLEATILGSGAGDANTPAGIFADYQSGDNTIASFEDVANLEASLEDANVYGEKKYILSPSAKATLRSMIKGTNGTGMVMENGEIDGTPAVATSNVETGLLAVGDFSNIYIGQWDSIQLDVVRDTASLCSGCVTIVVNAFFDAQVAREEAIVCANV